MFMHKKRLFFQKQHTDVNIESKNDNVKNNDYDKVERRAREKLKRWQAFQAARGIMDNTVNKVLENMMLPADHLDQDSTVNSIVSRLRLFQGNYMSLHGTLLHGGDSMEDTAVMMAIRNHGLVKTAKLVSQSHNDRTPGCRNVCDYIGVHCSSPSSRTQDIKGSSTTLPTTSSNLLGSSNPIEMGRCNTSNSDADKIYDSDQPEDFLERAVAEAIKKKGLSALSVLDY